MQFCFEGGDEAFGAGIVLHVVTAICFYSHCVDTSSCIYSLYKIAFPLGFFEHLKGAPGAHFSPKGTKPKQPNAAA